MTEAVSAPFLALWALKLALELERAGALSASPAPLPLKAAAQAFFTQPETLACCSGVSIHLKVWKTWGQWLLFYDIRLPLITNNLFESKNRADHASDFMDSMVDHSIISITCYLQNLHCKPC